ncbi:MAG TPA: hypothetical protein VMU84_04875 [Thermoanaerobaculia bacterium]|nr:hypothetical protein [Thermoanaerobaculia bacterium]
MARRECFPSPQLTCREAEPDAGEHFFVIAVRQLFSELEKYFSRSIQIASLEENSAFDESQLENSLRVFRCVEENPGFFRGCRRFAPPFHLEQNGGARVEDLSELAIAVRRFFEAIRRCVERLESGEVAPEHSERIRSRLPGVTSERELKQPRSHCQFGDGVDCDFGDSFRQNWVGIESFLCLIDQMASHRLCQCSANVPDRRKPLRRRELRKARLKLRDVLQHRARNGRFEDVCFRDFFGGQGSECGENRGA